MNRSGKLHALLSTARVANIPSVVSNVWLGVAVGAVLNLGDSNSDIVVIPWISVSKLTLAGICLYVAGNFLNDWMDREWDASHRPERALPQGLFTQGLYRNTAIAVAVAGLTLATSVNWLAGAMAAAITVCIVIYTVWHKRAEWAVVPMGLCRGFLPMMGALGMFSTPVDATNIGVFLSTVALAAWTGTALFCYIMGLSLSARYESAGRPNHSFSNLAVGLFGVAGFLIIAAALFSGNVLLILVGPAPFCIWLFLSHTVYRKTVPQHVSALLAGIPLLDWGFLMPGALWELSMNASRLPSQPLEWVSLALPPLAFIFALLLQRLAPAT